MMGLGIRCSILDGLTAACFIWMSPLGDISTLHAAAEDPGRGGSGFNNDTVQLRQSGGAHPQQVRTDLDTEH